MSGPYAFEMVIDGPESAENATPLREGTLGLCVECLAVTARIFESKPYPMEWLSEWGFRAELPAGWTVFRISERLQAVRGRPGEATRWVVSSAVHAGR